MMGRVMARVQAHLGNASRRPGERLLDVTEAATMLGVKPSTLYQWAYQRRVPKVKVLGRALRFRLSDLERIICDGHCPALESPLDRQ